MKKYYYLVPDFIAQELNLSKYRHAVDGGYILSESDLEAYGIDKAVEAGAIPMDENEAKSLIN